jgi:hypothetical protein
MDTGDQLFLVWSLLFQIALILHFALRKGAFSTYIVRYGWLFYALALPALAVSLVLIWAGEDWPFWIGGFLFVTWAVFGFVVEYVRKIDWRSPFRWSVGGPYILLYLATVMFYWWPVALVSRPLWYLYAALFVIGTVLNVTSHRPARRAT